jgi:hypothetical protein
MALAAPSYLMRSAGEAALGGITGLASGVPAGIGAVVGAAQGDPERGLKILEQGTYKLSAGGKIAGEVAALPMTLAEKYINKPAGEKTFQATNNPALATAAETIPRAIEYLAGGKSGAVAGEEAAAVAGAAAARRAEIAAAIKPSQRQRAIRTAADLHVRLTPEMTGKNPIGHTVMGLSNSAKVERGMALKNAPDINERLNAEVGIKARDADPEVIAERLHQVMEPRRRIEATGTRVMSPEYQRSIDAITDQSKSGEFSRRQPNEAIQTLKHEQSGQEYSLEAMLNRESDLRLEGNMESRSKRRLDTRALATQRSSGSAKIQAANALRAEIKRHLTEIGKPELFDQYVANQKTYAKLKLNEQAAKAGHYNSQIYAQAMRRGVPLSGVQLKVAKLHEFAKPVLQHPASVKSTSPFGVFDPLIAGGMAHFLHPAGAAVMLARPAARGVLASEAYQRHFIWPKGRAGAEARARRAAPETPPPANDKGLGAPQVEPAQPQPQGPSSIYMDMATARRRPRPSQAVISRSAPAQKLLEDEAMRAMPNRGPAQATKSEPPTLAGTSTLEERLKDPGMRETLGKMKWKAGQEMKGGQMYRNIKGEVVGRTSHLPGAKWWMDRPTTLSAAETRAAVDKALAGEKLTKRERIQIEYMTNIAMSGEIH